MNLQQQLHDKFRENMQLSESQQLLLCSTPVDWDWPVAQHGYIEKSEYDFVGYMPQPVEEGKLYFTRSDREVFQAYSTVIESVNPAKSDQYHEELGNIDNEIKDAKSELDKDNDLMKKGLEEARKEPKKEPEFDEETWKEISGWKSILDADLKALETLTDDKKYLIENWDNLREEAVKAIGRRQAESIGPGYVKMMNRGKIFTYPNFDVDKNSQQWAQKIRTERSGAIGLLEGFMISTNMGHEDESLLHGGLKVFGKSIFSFHKDKYLEESDVRISIKYKAHTKVSVHPDSGWYKSDYLSQICQDNHWKHPKDSSETMFGSKGTLHSIISGFIAVYQPSYNIQMSEKASKEEHANEFYISLPPFINGPIPGFSASGNSVRSFMSSRLEANNSITIESHSEYPQIVGIIVNKPIKCKKLRCYCVQTFSYS